ncbi:MAG: filamentous hemagglutinin N-terminal domain-containing protein [Parachlamydiales bacterium]|nr:filamentous hemagglutinin N-terminal domain-containing protein [Parachlamydiales bacterium]
MKWFAPFLLMTIYLQANPTGPAVMGGEANISETKGMLEIATGDRAVIHWDSFSIQAGETTRFIQPAIDSAVLNKVIGSEISQLNGLLQANGQVYLVNPNGVLIGPEGRIDTAAFMATALDIKSGEFLNGEALALQGDSLGKIINLGTIETKTGPVALIGHRIENAGEIHGGTVSLIASHSVIFDATGDSVLFIQPDLKSDGIELSGKLEALKVVLQADTPPSTLAIGLGGLIDATTIENVGGEIYLTASSGDIAILGELTADKKIIVHAEEGTTELYGALECPSGEIRLLGKSVHLMENATVDVSGDFQGGTVLVGGDYRGKNSEIPNAERVLCHPDAEIHADAKIQGDGGKVIFWGDQAMLFFGKVNARGGAEGGNGGFVEVSSPGQYSYHGLTNTLAPKGKTGTLLLDPTTLTISTAATTATFAAMTYSGTAANDVINNTELENNLALSNITIDATAGGGGGAGHIIFNAPVSWSQNLLTLTAQLDLQLNSTWNISGTGSVSMTVPQDLRLNSGSIINYSSSSPLIDLNGSNLVADGHQFSCTSPNILVRFRGISENCIINNSTITNTGSGTVLDFRVGGGLSNLQMDNSVVSTTGAVTIYVSAGFSNLITVTDSIINAADTINATIEATGAIVIGTSAFAASGSGGINFNAPVGASDIQISGSDISTSGSGSIFFNASGVLGEVYIINSSVVSTTGTGSIGFDVSGPLGQMHFNNCTFTSNMPMTAAPNTFLNLLGNININIPQPVTLTSLTQTPLVRGGSATINTTTSLLSFPVGINSTPLTTARDLTINAVYGTVSFGANSTLTALNVTAGANIDIQSTLDVQLTNLYLNAGGNINLANGSVVQGVGAVTLIAGNHIIGSGSGLIQTINANDLYLVTDNRAPTTPDVRTGVFQLSGYTLQTNSGLGGNNIVFLYTSLPTLYISSPISGALPSTINGLPHSFGFFSGTTYNKGVNEFLYTYFPNLPVDPPSFELIFKTTGISPVAVTTIEVAVTEPVSNPPQITQIIEGNLSSPSTPDPKTPCRTPPVSVQAL